MFFLQISPVLTFVDKYVLTFGASSCFHLRYIDRRRLFTCNILALLFVPFRNAKCVVSAKGRTCCKGRDDVIVGIQVVNAVVDLLRRIRHSLCRIV